MLIAQSRTSLLDCKICSSSPRFGGVLGFADTTEQIWLENAFVYYSSTFEWDLKGKWSSLRARLAVARGLSASASLSDSVRRALLWTRVVERARGDEKRRGLRHIASGRISAVSTPIDVSKCLIFSRKSRRFEDDHSFQFHTSCCTFCILVLKSLMV